MQALIDMLDFQGLIPHGYCLSWSPILLWLHVTSDLLITLAYYSIPITLVYFIRQRRDFPYPWLVVMFAGFIVACGTTHLLSVITIWVPVYWLDGLLKAVTAIISIATAVLMLWVIPRALSLPSAAQLKVEIQQRKTAEEALRESENKLSTILDSVEAFIFIKDCNYQYQYANRPVRQLFGKALEDIIGKSDEAFFDEVTARKLREDDRRVLELGERLASENVNTNKDGATSRTYYTVKQPLCHEGGSIYGLCGISTDISERKRAERVLNQLKAMIDISLDGYWIVDLMGNLLQVNEAYASISGYSVDELLTMNISQLEALEGPEQVKSHIKKVIAQGGYDLFETRHRHKQGHLIDIEISVAFLPEYQQFCVFCRDISARKIMEDELKASEAKFRSIIEASPVPMALNDERFNITFLNPAFEQTIGYHLDDIPTLEDWWAKAYPDQDYRRWVVSTWQTALEKAKQEHTEFSPLELTIRCKNNGVKTVLASAAPINKDFSGEHLVILYDITQRKQTEDKLNAIFNASVDAIISYDTSDTIVSANSAVEAIFGYKPQELVGNSIHKIMRFSPKDINGRYSAHAAECAQIQEIEGVHKSGSVVPLDLSMAEYSIDGARYFTNIVRDVSLRKRQELQNKEHLAELAHVTRLGLMGEMASGIAHEVNQPLSAIASYTHLSLSLINSEKPDLVMISEILSKTNHQALRAGRIIHRMREFVKSQTRKRSTVDINALMHDAVSLCIAEIKQNGIRLTVEFEKNLPPIYADHVQIEQVVINLIRNSIDALQALPSEQQRELSLRTQLMLDSAIQVMVKDNGPGIDQEQQQKILTPFYTTKPDGMGMGLSISRSLIEAHEGTLQFNSEPGKGTTFYFTLPTMEASGERQ